jgi:hypothetical protein
MIVDHRTLFASEIYKEWTAAHSLHRKGGIMRASVADVATVTLYRRPLFLSPGRRFARAKVLDVPAGVQQG